MQVKGLYDKTIYCDVKSGYKIFLLIKDNYEKVSCAGYIPAFSQNTPITLNGDFVTNTKEKQYFKFQQFELCQPSQEQCIKFLNALLPNQNTNEIFDLAEKLPQNFIELCKNNDYETLINSTDLSLKPTINTLYQKVKNIENQYVLFSDIIKAGGTYNSIMKITEKYESNSLYELKKNPYKIGARVNLSFQCCDFLAFQYNIPNYDSIRIRAMLFDALDKGIRNGDVYITVNDLKNHVDYLNKISVYDIPIPLEMVLIEILNNHNVYTEKINNETHIYSRKMWEFRNSFVKDFHRFQTNVQTIKKPFTDMLYIEKNVGLELSPEQINSLKATESSGIHIITGGPGTGKTTIINALIKKFQKEYPTEDFALCAPTGRAAQKISESTGYQAYTINKLIDYRPFENADDYRVVTEQLNYKMIIIDEFSMVSLNLAALLFSVLKTDTIIVCVGDVDQLPSVEPGRVLDDLIESGNVPLFRLTYIYRQDNEHESISKNAYKVKNKDLNLIQDDSFRIYKSTNQTEFVSMCKRYFQTQYSSCKDLFDFQVLVPIKKGYIGVNEINKSIQQNETTPYIRFGNHFFFIGDKIIFTKTNYEKNYFNGDFGTVTDVCDVGIEVQLLDGKYIEINNAHLDELLPAYAITVHKSQGSECNEIAIILSEEAAGMLSIKLLYTAITRAKKRVALFVENNALEQVLTSKMNNYVRKSGLTGKI